MSSSLVRVEKGDYFPDAHPREYRQLAYELWAFVYDQNARKVAERIASPQEDDPLEAHEIAPRTIRKWALQEKWAERHERDMKALAPGIHKQVDSTIIAATPAAAAYLRRVVEDESIDHKHRLDAAKTLLDRGGHMPWVRPPDNSKPRGPGKDYSETFAGKTMEELVGHLFGDFMQPTITGHQSPPTVSPEDTETDDDPDQRLS